MKREYKELFNEITPDEKLLDSVLDKATQRKSPLILKKAGAVILAAAILCGSAGYYSVNSNNDDITTKSQSTVIENNLLSFSIVAYAKDSDKSDMKTLKEDDITLMDYKLRLQKDGEGYSVGGNSQTGFSINAKGVSEVTFTCQNGRFDYIDGPLKKYMEEQGAYYSIVIPLTDKENEEYLRLCRESESGYYPERKYFEALMEKNDYSKYFDGKSTNLAEYSIYYSDKEDYMNENQFLLIEDSEALKYWIRDTKEFTAKTYSNDDIISDVGYDPTAATNYLLDHPETPYDELPTDELTITVKFKSGQSVTKKYIVSFNKDGRIQFEYVK